MTKQTTPLRQRMIEDMTIRNMSPSTQKIYVAAVANFSIFHGRSPDKLTFEDVRDYRLHLISRGLKPNSINPIMGALRFFYRTTLGLKEVSERIPYARRSDPLPAVLARDEVERLLKAVTDLNMRTAFITIYGAGLVGLLTLKIALVVILAAVLPHFRGLMVLPLIGFALRGFLPSCRSERSANDALPILTEAAPRHGHACRVCQ